MRKLRKHTQPFGKGRSEVLACAQAEAPERARNRQQLSQMITSYRASNALKCCQPGQFRDRRNAFVRSSPVNPYLGLKMEGQNLLVTWMLLEASASKA